MAESSTRRDEPPLGTRWTFRDAKARLSEVVRRACDIGPQRITLHGKDAVVIVAAEAYERSQERRTGRYLVEALAAAPLREVEFDRRPFVNGPVRDIEV